MRVYIHIKFTIVNPAGTTDHHRLQFLQFSILLIDIPKACDAIKLDFIAGRRFAQDGTVPKDRVCHPIPGLKRDCRAMQPSFHR